MPLANVISERRAAVRPRVARRDHGLTETTNTEG